MSKKATFLHILQLIGPIALMAIPGRAGQIARNVATPIVQGISEATEIRGTNDEKKAHALAVVAKSQDALAAAGIDVSQDELMSAASHAIDTVIDTVHVVEGTHKATNNAQTSDTPS